MAAGRNTWLLNEQFVLVHCVVFYCEVVSRLYRTWCEKIE
jgi:hypothetical protein